MAAQPIPIPPPTVPPPGAQSQLPLFVENFARVLAEHFGDQCVPLTLLPWSGQTGPKPAGVLSPVELGSNASLDDTEVDPLLQGKPMIIVPATFDPPEEEAAWRLLPKFTQREDICVFIAHLLPPGRTLSREANDHIMKRHDAMLATGADDVLMNPEPEPEALRRSIFLARSVWQLNVRRMQLMLEAEAEPVSREEMQQLMTQHRRLLWDSIPRALMHNFRVVDRSLLETSVSVGKYRFVRKMETRLGTVLQAMDEKSQSVAIKVIDKSTVCTPGELEGIYRECRFLSDMIQHPNAARCIDMLHSQSRVYLIFDYAGDQNLMQVLAALPGSRLDCAVALHVFDGLASALAYCHSKEVTHRAVSLEHVVLLAQPGRQELFRVTLVDFNSAMVARGETTSRTQCGGLPCIAPEVALGTAYVPWRADCWSTGIVLLEAAGGVSTLAQCAPYQTGIEPLEAAPAIQNYFAQPGAHERALAYVGGVRHEAVQQKLEALLQAQPANRTRIGDLVSTEYAARIQETMIAQRAQAQAAQPQPPPQPPLPQQG